MRTIGVIDVLAGQAVAAHAGDRANYQPLRSQLCEGSDPAKIARALQDHCSINEFYLADLDRLSQRPANTEAWRRVGQVADRLWLDAGITDRDDFHGVCDEVAKTNHPNTTVIVASESWMAPDWPPHNHLGVSAAYGLDLKSGVFVSPLPRWNQADPIEVASKLIDRGWSRFVVLDVAAVGTGNGCPTMGICRSLRQLSSDIEIITGGGIRDRDDLLPLQFAGCDAILISTALHQKTLV